MEVSPEELRARTEAFADQLQRKRPELDRDELTRMLDPDSAWPVDTRAELVVNLAMDRAGLEAQLPDDSVPESPRWRRDLEDTRWRLIDRVGFGLSAAAVAAEAEQTRDSLSTLSGPDRGRDLADQVVGMIETKSAEYGDRAERGDWSVALSADEARLLVALEQEPPDVRRPAAVKPANKKVTALVQQVADVVNQRAGTNSPIRQVGVDPDSPRGVRVAGPDAIVLGTEDHEALAKIGRSRGTENRFERTAQALAGVTEAVTDLAVSSEPAPPLRRPAERGAWDRPLDLEYLTERNEHRAIQQAVTAASPDPAAVVAAHADRQAVGQRFADLARDRPLPRPAMEPVGQAFAEGIRAKLEAAGVENPPQVKDLLADVNRERPELKARAAAKRLLAAAVPEWWILDDPPYAAAMVRLTSQISRDFAAVTPSSATAADGRSVGERAAAAAVAIRAEAARHSMPPPPEAARELSTGTAFAGTTPLDSAKPPATPSAATPAVGDGPALGQETKRDW